MDYGETDYFKDEGKRYAMLPVDEELFTIDANSRYITVPKHFRQNGIGVIGDQMAEVVYFKIARYHDFTDLNTTNIYIQWEVTSSQGTQQGASKAWVRDIETDPDSIIFGWALDSSITGKGGRIKFSVRFVQFNDDEDTKEVYPLSYNFSTLDAEVSINSALNLAHDTWFTNSEQKEYFDRIDRILKTRIKSGVQVGTAQPKTPIFTTDLQLWAGNATQLDLTIFYLEKESVTDTEFYAKKTVYYTKSTNTETGVEEYTPATQYIEGTTYYIKDTNDSYVEIKITQLEFDERKTIYYTRDVDGEGNYIYSPAENYTEGTTYYIQEEKCDLAVHAYIPNATGTLTYVWERNDEDSSRQASDKYIYVLTKDTKPAKGKVYYEYADGKYKVDTSIDTDDEYMPFETKTEVDENGKEISVKVFKERYEKLNCFSATQSGNYEVFAINTVPGNSVQRSGGTITIPGATLPEFETDGKTGFIYTTTATSFDLQPKPKTVPGETYSYQWYYAEGENDTKTPIQDATEKEYTVIKGTDNQGAYYLHTTALRNKDKKDNMSKAFVVTNSADTISSVVYSNSTEKDKTWTEDGDILNVNVGTVVYAKPVFEGNYQITDYQNFTYTWYYVKDKQAIQIGEGNLSSNAISPDSSLAGYPIYCKIQNNYNGSISTGPSVNSNTKLPSGYIVAMR